MVLRMRRATILWLLLLILLHAAIGRNIRSVVFDVGFNDGLDTASFLAQGFRVVAVEANAGLVLAFSKKEPFSSALADGRLVLLNVAITNQTGVNVTFYINHLDPKLSTMDPRHFAGMAGRPKPAPVSVPGATCAGLLSTYGVPHYLKVDIEGFDEVCYYSILESLNVTTAPLSHMSSRSTEDNVVARSRLPKFLSTEDVGLPILRALFRAGYESVKCQSRGTHGNMGLGGGPWGDEAIDSAGINGGSNTKQWRNMKSFIEEKEAKQKAFRPTRMKNRCCHFYHVCRDADFHMRLGLP